jgi:hypothetical protein
MHVDHSTDFRRARLGLAAAALTGALVGALALGAVEDAAAVKAERLGETRKTARPSCPKTPCEAVGSVTGFQATVGGQKGIFKIRRDGHIVAWSVDTSRPNAEQREFFGDFYDARRLGADPSARIGILRREKKVSYELRRQSPAVTLSSDLGTRPVITLRKPLAVKQGDILALTIPTWLSSFAVGQARRDVWRASRTPKGCTGRKAIQEGRPHQKVGSVRHYGCRYTTARLLYWGYFVPDGGEKSRR